MAEDTAEGVDITAEGVDITAEAVAIAAVVAGIVGQGGMPQAFIEQRPPGTPRRPLVLSPLAPASR
jgi:hypothetical protein